MCGFSRKRHWVFRPVLIWLMCWNTGFLVWFGTSADGRHPGTRFWNIISHSLFNDLWLAAQVNTGLAIAVVVAAWSQPALPICLTFHYWVAGFRQVVAWRAGWLRWLPGYWRGIGKVGIRGDKGGYFSNSLVTMPIWLTCRCGSWPAHRYAFTTALKWD